MRKILLAAMLVFATICLQSQSLYIHPISGEHVEFLLASKPKITFGNGTKTIHQTTFQLADIQKLSFKSDNSTNIVDVETHGRVSLHPNPVENELQLNIQIPVQGLIYRIFDMTGKLQKTDKIHSETTTINMQNFRTGIYIFNIDQNGQQIQSFKIVKQ
ncbi:MAG: T9SS type A sorting domain-containing protein [Bacteroidales bacterium]|jgi:hypothetical protein|nr:T9SS type A sorting domain-containing protein [Bacteroidales bacterium]